MGGESGEATVHEPPPSTLDGRSATEDWIADHGITEVIVSAEDLERRVLEIGRKVTEDYDGRPLLLLGVLKGAFVFMSDLARAIDLPVEIDIMAISSYGAGTTSSGVIRIVKDLDADLTGRHVLVVEDIVDSGVTLTYLKRNLMARHPASLEVCALLVKETAHAVIPTIKYVGFQIPADFVVGYGLDVAEKYRNLSDIRRYEPVPSGTGSPRG
ncbi:MAG: hypoxanthine phosphoribosyltransferase [Acidimicrobiales bacterium]